MEPINNLGGQCGRGMSSNVLAEIARLLKSWETAPPAWMIDPRRDFKDEARCGAPWAVLADPKAGLNGGGTALWRTGEKTYGCPHCRRGFYADGYDAGAWSAGIRALVNGIHERQEVLPLP